MMKRGIVQPPSLLFQFPFVCGTTATLTNGYFAQGIFERSTAGIVGIRPFANFTED
jgi:hypothetical protein